MAYPTPIYSGIVPSGALGDELGGLTRRAFIPRMIVQLYKSSNHMENFFDCVRSRKAPICDVETGHRSASMCHLGAISLRTGHKLAWDGTKEQFTGEFAREANPYLRREMRAPYDYSFVS